jgi:hypothetical protein
LGPGAERVKGKVWRASSPPEARIFQVVTAEPPLRIASQSMSDELKGQGNILMSYGQSAASIVDNRMDRAADDCVAVNLREFS